MQYPNNTDPSTKPEKNSEANPGLEKVSTNPNPRANENLEDEDIEKGDSDDVGSEITDGEAG